MLYGFEFIVDYVKCLLLKLGVYCMFDEDGVVLYVGKVCNFKNCVSNYVNGCGYFNCIVLMIVFICFMEFVVM